MRLVKEIVSKGYWGLTLTVLLLTIFTVNAHPQSNYTADTETAQQFGAHEITLTGDGSVENPFEIEATVTFIPPTGQANAKTVDMFYDGNDTWRARVYVNEIGQWSWLSQSEDDALLNGQSGLFQAVESNLRGMLRPHPVNPRQWATDNGEWFLNISDTAYKLFNGAENHWQDYVRDNAEMGVTSVRSGALGGWEWSAEGEASNYPWDGDALTRFNLDKFQTADTRLQWMLDHYPDMYVQFIIFGNIDWQTDEVGLAWKELPSDVRANTMRYMIARWAAYPQLFWLVGNDMSCDEAFPNNRQFAREVGAYFAEHDPWNHLLSSSPARSQSFCFTEAQDANWVSYIHLEGGHELGAEWINDYTSVPMHIFLGEDYYEQDHPTRYPRYPRYFQRWLFWSWLLAGGSANYGGRYPVIHPYSYTELIPFTSNDIEWGRLEGLDSVPYIAPYFEQRAIDLSLFQPDQGLVSDLAGRDDNRRPLLMRRNFDEFIIYHPNAASGERDADVDHGRLARLRLDLRSADGTFVAEWYRPYDGIVQPGICVQGGDFKDLSAPWRGYDVVLRLVRETCSPPTPTPTVPAPTATATVISVVEDPRAGLQILYTFNEGSGDIVRDTSGVEEALDLTIEDVSAVTWIEGGLSVNSPTLITSTTTTTRLIEAIRSTNAMTLETWIQPANTSQNGPARIVTLSPDANMRYFSLGQGLGDSEPSSLYDMRLRTTMTDVNGIPSLSTQANTLATELSYVVYTRDATGTARMYLNGSEAANGTIGGDLSNWQDNGFHLALANELSLDRPWLGEYRFVAIYNRALSASEVEQNWMAGSER
jgi:hypothetical protein